MASVERVPVGLESFPMTLNLREKLLGPDKNNLNYIKRCTGAEVTLRGWRSGYLEQETSMESLEPLHIRIEHQNIGILQKARQLVVDLIESVHEELLESKQSPPHVQSSPVVTTPLLHRTHSPHQSQGLQNIINTKSAQQQLFENQQTQSNKMFLEKQLTALQSVPELDSSQKIDQFPQIFQQLKQEFQTQPGRLPSHHLSVPKLSMQEVDNLTQLVQNVQHILQVQPEQQSSRQVQSLPYPSTARETEQLIELMQQLLQTLSTQTGIQSESLELKSKPSETPEPYHLTQAMHKLLQEFKDQCDTSNSEQQIAKVIEEILQVLEAQPDISAKELEQLVEVIEQLSSIFQIQPNTSVSELQYLTFLTRNLELLLDNETNVGDLKKLTEIIKTLQQAVKAQPKSSRELKEFLYVLQRLSSSVNKLKWSSTIEGGELIIVLYQLVNEIIKMSTEKPTEDLPMYKLGGTVQFKHTVDLHQGLKQPPPTPSGLLWSVSKENELEVKDVADGTENRSSASRHKRKFEESYNYKNVGEVSTNEQSGQNETVVNQEMSCTDNILKQNQEEYKTENNEISDSDTLKQSSVLLGGRDLRITLVPSSVDSLYASLAYLLLGPFSSITKLITAAKSLHQQMIHYIKDNKELFFTDICKLYCKVFPDRKFDPVRAYENCCQYGAELGHEIIYEPIFVISTMVNTPVVVLYEDGGLLKVDPVVSCDDKPPVSVLYRSSQASFNPVDVFAKNFPSSKVDHEDVPRLLSPSQDAVSNNIKSITLCHKLVVATWTVQCMGDLERERIDECLSKYNVDLAVIQEILNANQNTSTTNYNWFFKSFPYVTRAVSLVVRKSSQATLSNFHFHSTTVSSATVFFNKALFTVIGCSLTLLCLDSLNQITDAIDSAPSSSQILLLGNFNAHIGYRNLLTPEKLLIGKNILHERCNKSGVLLKKLAVQYDLHIVTTFSEQNTDKRNIQQNRVGTFTEKPPSATAFINNIYYQKSHILLQKPFQDTISFNRWEPFSNDAIVICHIYIES